MKFTYSPSLGLTNSLAVDKIKKERLRKKNTLQTEQFNFRYLNIGYYILTPILLGVFLGLGLDYWLNTKPLFISIFIFLGTVASFYNLIKLLKDE